MRAWISLRRRSRFGRLVKRLGLNARALFAGTYALCFPHSIDARRHLINTLNHSVFLNMMVAGTPRNEAEALGGLHPFNYIIDIPAGTADILGDGKTPISFTSTQDIGRFVAGSLDLEHWEPTSAMAGDKKTCEELVEIAERVTGGSRKLLRRYTSVEEFRKRTEGETDPFRRFPSQVREHPGFRVFICQCAKHQNVLPM